MNEGVSAETAAEAARHVKGATIAWGPSGYYDFLAPNPEIISLEDVAYALAYTVRWRGQTRTIGDRRCFYGVGEHCVRMACQVLADGHSDADALAALFHEPDEVVLPDMPGPVKPLIKDYRALAALQGDALIARFGIHVPDPDLIKRYDIRMLLTERRDLFGWAHRDKWYGQQGTDAAPLEGYEPFDGVIVPFPHPDQAAVRFLNLCQRFAKGITEHG